MTSHAAGQSVPPPDLAVDSDNDGTVNAADAAVEDEGSGVIIPVNDDDDDHDGTPDMDQPGTVPGEDDLAELKLSLFPPDAGGTVELTVPSGGDKVRLYETADRSTPLTQTTWAAGQQPASVWAEGTGASSSVGDAHFALAFVATGLSQPTGDAAPATSVEVDVDKVWSDQIPDVTANASPNETGSANKPYLLVGARNDGKEYIKARVTVTPDVPTIRAKVKFGLFRGWSEPMGPATLGSRNVEARS